MTASGRCTSARNPSPAMTNGHNSYTADVLPMLPVYLSPMSPAVQRGTDQIDLGNGRRHEYALRRWGRENRGPRAISSPVPRYAVAWLGEPTAGRAPARRREAMGTGGGRARARVRQFCTRRRLCVCRGKLERGNVNRIVSRARCDRGDCRQQSLDLRCVPARSLRRVCVGWNDLPTQRGSGREAPVSMAREGVGIL